MLALRLDERGARVAETEAPELLPGSAVVRVALAGVCNTDLELLMGIQGADGAFAEYVRVPVANLHAVPDAVPDRS